MDPETPQEAGPGNESDAPVGVRLQKPQQVAPPSGDAALVYGPTSRPDEPITRNHAPSMIPEQMWDAIPGLITAASDPKASPALKAMARLIDYHINGKS